MFFTTFISSEADIERVLLAGSVQEVLIGPELLCRESWLSNEVAFSLAKCAVAAGLKPVLVWDVLMPEETLTKVTSELTYWDFSIFSAIRVQDIGALQWLRETKPAMPLQLIVETGNANLPGLKRWESVLGESLQRLILSYQLPEEKIIAFLNELSVPCEVLGAGPILLFYSPRPLLTPKIEITSGASDWLYAVSSSVESHQREFPTLENTHGTFMYLNKDLFILDKLAALAEAGLHTVRIDLRQVSERPDSAVGFDSLLAAVVAGESKPTQWPKPAFAPFFRRNNTTKQFKKLKPQIHEQRDERCVARVLMGRKPYQMVLWALRDFAPDGTYILALPDGSEVPCGALTFRNMHGVTVDLCIEDQLLITPWVKKCCSGALLLVKE